jgi:hypothetical protein
VQIYLSLRSVSHLWLVYGDGKIVHFILVWLFLTELRGLICTLIQTILFCQLWALSILHIVPCVWLSSCGVYLYISAKVGYCSNLATGNLHCLSPGWLLSANVNFRHAIQNFLFSSYICIFSATGNFAYSIGVTIYLRGLFVRPIRHFCYFLAPVFSHFWVQGIFLTTCSIYMYSTFRPMFCVCITYMISYRKSQLKLFWLRKSLCIQKLNYEHNQGERDVKSSVLHLFRCLGKFCCAEANVSGFEITFI